MASDKNPSSLDPPFGFLDVRPPIKAFLEKNSGWTMNHVHDLCLLTMWKFGKLLELVNK